MQRWLVLSSVLAGNLVFAVSPNLLENGGFDFYGDRNAKADGWQISNPSQTTVEADTALYRSSPASLKLSVADDAPIEWYSASRSVEPLKPRAAYTLSAWVKAERVRDGAGAYLSLNFFDARGKRLAYFDSPAKAQGSCDWKRLTTTGTVPAGASKMTAILCVHGHGTAWFDDVQVEVGPAATAFQPAAADSIRIARDADEIRAAAAWLAKVPPRPDGRGRIAVLAMDAPPAPSACPSDPATLVVAFAAAGHAAFTVTPEQIANRRFLSPEHIDLLVVPTGDAFPSAAHAALVAYLEAGGAFLAMGGYVFDRPLTRANGAWFDPDTLPIPDAPLTLLDPTGRRAWSPSSNRPGGPQIRTSVGLNGMPAVVLTTPELTGWDTAGLSGFANQLPRDWSITRFLIDGRPQFLMGCQNYWGQNKSVTARSPLGFERDYRAMRDGGLRWTRCFVPFQTEEDKRISDAMVQLAQKFGLVFYHTPNLHNTADPSALAEETRTAREIAERYRSVPGFAIDICNEPSFRSSDTSLTNAFSGPVKPEGAWDDLETAAFWRHMSSIQRAWAASNAAAIHAGNPAGLAAVGWSQGWGNVGKTAVMKDPALASLDLDFTDRHYYGKPAPFAAELKDLDLRGLGKPFILGECGAKDHPTFKAADPWGMGDDDDAYDRRFSYLAHHAFGLGAAVLSSWHWRDPMEGVFPCGIVYQTGVARPTERLYRAMALTFGALKPASVTPEIHVVLPDAGRQSGSRDAVIRAFHTASDWLVSCRASFGLIPDGALDQLPHEAKALVYPVPFDPSDTVIERLACFVEAGGCLYISGDFSYDAQRKPTRRVSSQSPKTADPWEKRRTCSSFRSARATSESRGPAHSAWPPKSAPTGFWNTRRSNSETTESVWSKISDWMAS